MFVLFFDRLMCVHVWCAFRYNVFQCENRGTDVSGVAPIVNANSILTFSKHKHFDVRPCAVVQCKQFHSFVDF